MAFKSYVSPGVGTTQTGTSPTVAAGATATVIGYSVSNTASVSINISVSLYKHSQGVQAHIIKDATVLPGGTIIVVGGDQKVVLESGDVLNAESSQASSADIVMSYLEA